MLLDVQLRKCSSGALARPWGSRAGFVATIGFGPTAAMKSTPAGVLPCPPAARRRPV